MNISPIPAAALEQHVALVGKTGSGKTYGAKGVVEGLLDQGRRVCIIDPVGVWWGLRSSADGNLPAYPVVVFGGDHADIPIGDQSGSQLAGIVADEQLACVIDLSDFTNAGRHRFMSAFAAELYRRNRTALHLVLDEADEFVPQNPLAEAKRMSGEVDRIIRRGRARGFRVMLIAQRTAVLHKNALTQCNMLVAFRFTSPQDRDAIQDWIRAQADVEEGRRILSSLPTLAVGDAWVWAPEQAVLKCVTFPTIRTLDTSRTPDQGEDLAEGAVLADVDIGALASRLAANGDCEEPGRTPRPSKAEIETARKEGAEQFRAELQSALRTIVSSAESVEAAMANLMADLRSLEEQLTSAKPVAGKNVPAKARKRETPKAPRNDSRVSAGAQRLLEVLIAHYPATLTWTQVATLAKRKARGGHFNASRKELLDRLLVTETPEGVRIADPEAEALGLSPQALSEKDIYERWLEALPAPANRMFQWLFTTHGPGVWATLAAMAEDLDMKPRGGHWNSGLATLRRNDLIEQAGEHIRLTLPPLGEES